MAKRRARSSQSRQAAARSRAASKGWATRRAAAAKRSAAARKGWSTRRAAEKKTTSRRAATGKSGKRTPSPAAAGKVSRKRVATPKRARPREQPPQRAEYIGAADYKASKRSNSVSIQISAVGPAGATKRDAREAVEEKIATGRSPKGWSVKMIDWKDPSAWKKLHKPLQHAKIDF